MSRRTFLNRQSDSPDDSNGDDMTEYHRLMSRLRDIGHAPQTAIEISDDDNDDGSDDDTIQSVRRVEQQDFDVLLEDEIAEFVDLTDGDFAPAPALDHSTTRNKPVEDHLRLRSCHHNGMLIEEGTMVEIQKLPKVSHYIQFLEVQLIWRPPGGPTILRGIPFTRARHLIGQLPLKKNEIVAVMDIHEDDPREWTTQAAIEVHTNTSDIICVRDFQRTNSRWPAHKFSTKDFGSKRAIEDMGVLTCRWQMVSFYKSAAAQKQDRLHSRSFIRLRAHEVTIPELRKPDSQLLTNWRGGKVRGGAYFPEASSGRQQVPIVDLTGDDEPAAVKRAPGQKYTHADMFCGAGGASSGARAAGFKTIIACDLDHDACNTYTLNFPDTDLFEMSVYDLVTDNHPYPPVDVLHISPPCQVWSPAHTTAGTNDEANLAALYACQEVLVKFRPRVVTVEQTFGLLQKRFQPFFNLFVHCFTVVDYSVSYKVTNLSEIGSSQPRKRLTMIASCPGERLPTFPRPTHSNMDDGLPGLVTVAEALSGIGPHATHHNVGKALARGRGSGSFPRPPYNPNVTLQYTITCSGGLNYHPSGERGFTLREWASLQGFPSDHLFSKRAARRQVGNAFPPPCVKAFYDHIHSWLLKEDRIKDAAEEDIVMLEAYDDDNRRWSSAGPAEPSQKS